MLTCTRELAVAISKYALTSIVFAPIVGREVWAAGVTYYRSRSARMESARSRTMSRRLRARAGNPPLCP